jgi:signal transduction histidine kinase
MTPAGCVAGSVPAMTRLLAWRRAEHATDGLLALALTLFAQLDLRINFEAAEHFGSELVAALVTAVATLALAFRRRAPLASACVVAAAVAGPELFGTLTIQLWGDFVPLLIAAYSVARHGSQRAAAIGVGALGVAIAVIELRVAVIGTTANIPFSWVPFLAASVAGRVLQARDRRHAQTSDQARRLATERDATVRAAIAEERARIARELHDIVAHSVSVMVVQAGAAEDLLDRDPRRARPPLRSIQESGRQAVAELSRMLGLLRGDHAALALTPQPGTAQLGELVTEMDKVGLPVSLTVEGTPRPLTPGVELAGFRIVQEALTNTLKHAGPATAAVRLRYAEEALEIEVVDDGRGGRINGSGHGLIGMRERVTLYGGALDAGPRPGGGFAVRARLPAEASP